MQCPRCGSQNDPGRESCHLCGFRFQSPPPPGPTTPATPAGADQPPTTSDDTPMQAATPEPQSLAAPPSESRHSQPDTHGHDHSLMPYQSPVEGELTTSRRGSRAPVLLVGLVALLAIIGTIAAVLLSMSAPGERGIFQPTAAASPTTAAASPTSTTFSTDPAVLLDMASRAMKDVRTLHYQSEAGFYRNEPASSDITGTNTLSITLSGDVELPDKYTMNTDAAPLGQFIVISDTTWQRKDGNPNWVQLSTSDVSLGTVNPLAITAYLQYYRSGSPRYVGSETRRDMLLHQVRFDVDTEEMAMGTPNTSVQELLLSSRIAADVWIRDTDHLLDSISLVLETRDGRNVILRTFLSRFNAEVDIRPPDAVTP